MQLEHPGDRQHGTTLSSLQNPITFAHASERTVPKTYDPLLPETISD